MKPASLLLVVVSLVVVISQSNADESQLGLMEILQSILNDPVFLALDDKHKLSVLIAVYQIIESHYRLKYENGAQIKRDVNYQWSRAKEIYLQNLEKV